ncbi:hypothetical protein [Chitinimonas sp.]|uniref:hypothetical protein n=1 Tax=Chitinimonas sp. TaxID=1934313 RepID=UPI0035AF296B
MSKRNWKRERPTSLQDAFNLSCDFALEEHRRPAKQMWELMATTQQTYSRWTAEASMPVNRIPQFEQLCGCRFVSDYLALAAGRMVVDLPLGKKADAVEVAELQARAAETMALLIRFYQGRAALDETLMALDEVLRGLGYHRANVVKVAEPELDFGGEE